jgi:hypothetical protein
MRASVKFVVCITTVHGDIVISYPSFVPLSEKTSSCDWPNICYPQTTLGYAYRRHPSSLFLLCPAAIDSYDLVHSGLIIQCAGNPDLMSPLRQDHLRFPKLAYDRQHCAVPSAFSVPFLAQSLISTGLFLGGQVTIGKSVEVFIQATTGYRVYLPHLRHY